MKKIAIGVSGRGSNMQALLRAHQKGELAVEPVVVFSNVASAPALDIAKAFSIPTIVLEHRKFNDRPTYDQALLDALQAYRIDGIVLAGFMRIMTNIILQAYPNAVMNIHPSLLPAFTGQHAVAQAMAYGVKITGCTAHFVDEIMDHGPIILQRSLEVLSTDNVESLSQRLLPLEHQTLLEAVNLWANDLLVVDARVVRIKAA